MSMMGTLAKLAMGYAAARGVDRLSGGQGLGTLMGGKAQLKGSEPGTAQQAQMGRMMSGGASNPLQDMMEQMQRGGLGAMLAGAGLGGGTGAEGSGAGMASILAAAGGASAMGGKGIGSMIDQFNAAGGSAQAEEAAGLMLRAMIQAAKADGEIDAAEKARLLDTIGEAASEEDIAFVEAQLAAPVDPEALARDTPEAQKTQVYAASLMTIAVDTDDEAEYLDRLAKSMGLSEVAVNQLHMQMGLQPLYR